MFDKIDTLNFHNKNIKFYVSNKTTTARVKNLEKRTYYNRVDEWHKEK